MGSTSIRPLALVTGASQGIGLEVARALAKKHSYNVLLGVRNVKKGEEIATELREAGAEASVIELDLSSRTSVLAAVSAIESRFGYLDVLVNNAGILFDRNPDLDRWDLYEKTLTTNVTGPGVLTEGLLPLLRKAKAGPPRVVFVSSVMGSVSMSADKTTLWYPIDYKVYDGSKAAVNVLAINFSRDLADVGGKVNSVCPGYINSNLTKFDSNGEPTENGAIRIVELATLGKDGPEATFSNRHGPLPW